METVPEHTRTFTCPCKKQTTATLRGLGGYNIGEARTKTGWTHLPLIDGGSVWLCPDCAKKAMDLGIALLGIVGTTYLHFSSLVRVAQQAEAASSKLAM